MSIMVMYFVRHYCRCKAGTKAYQDPALDGATICVDENECEMGSHTCHPSAQCWNTAGSYQCYCGHQQQCSRGNNQLTNNNKDP
jgi:hypothetical protein